MSIQLLLASYHDLGLQSFFPPIRSFIVEIVRERLDLGSCAGISRLNPDRILAKTFDSNFLSSTDFPMWNYGALLSLKQDKLFGF